MTEPFSDILSRLGSYTERQVLQKTIKLMEQGVETLKLYEPLPHQERFHAARERVVIMQKGNQVGGSLCGFAEFARATTNSDPHKKYPPKITAIVIGYGEDHIGETVYPYLFLPGHNDLRIVRDQVTNAWRIFRSWEGEINGKVGDKGREGEALPAPPLIPPRLWDDTCFSWKNKRGRIFKTCTLKNGSRIIAANSAGKPKHKQGFQVHLVLIDEDMANVGWYTEMIARTLKMRGSGTGFIRWNAKPHGGNLEMLDLMDQAKEEEEAERQATLANKRPPAKTVVNIRATIYDNPYIDPATRDENIKLWKQKGDHVYRQCVFGELSLGKLLMYPTCSELYHGIHLYNLPGEQVPHDWCRYAIFDPGITPGSVLFMAIPPEQTTWGNIALAYDELQIDDCTAAKLASAVQGKVFGQKFHDFIIDMHGGQVRDYITGTPIWVAYRDALEAVDITCTEHGSSFAVGSDDIQGRVEQTNLMMHASYAEPKGPPAFRYVIETTSNLQRELRSYKHKVVNQNGEEILLDDPNPRGHHLVINLEYFAAYAAKLRRGGEPLWHRPDRPLNQIRPWIKQWMKEVYGDDQHSTVLLS